MIHIRVTDHEQVAEEGAKHTNGHGEEDARPSGVVSRLVAVPIVLQRAIGVDLRWGEACGFQGSGRGEVLRSEP